MALAITGKTDPFDIVRTASGLHATDWSGVTFDPWVRTVRIKNAGSGVLSVGRAGNTGARAAGNDQINLAAGAVMDFYLAPGSQRPSSAGLTLFGADGAAHPIEWVLTRGGF